MCRRALSRAVHEAGKGCYGRRGTGRGRRGEGGGVGIGVRKRGAENVGKGVRRGEKDRIGKQNWNAREKNRKVNGERERERRRSKKIYI